MNVLILGGGGRESALAAAIAKSKRLEALFVAPGNPGCEEIAQRVEVDPLNGGEIARFCQNNAIDLVVVGPEAPLVAGIADDLADAGVACFGPSKAASKLEGSKGFTKDFCQEFGIPTAAYQRFSDRETALTYVRARAAPIVVKADGLAAGKGVVVAMTLAEAEAAIDSMFGGAFGAAGAELVIEEYMEGEEASLFAISDGTRVIAFSGAQDHKRVGDGDTGPNTGGMGAYSPAPVLSDEAVERAMREIIRPTVAGMAARGTPFKGVLFAGLMISDGAPRLIEFNVRFGDPEAEAILARLDDDLLEFLYGAATARLPDREPRFSSETALTVILAAQGYPGAVIKGVKIRGLELAAQVPGVAVLHAGTKRVGDDIVSDGGRVLAVTAVGADVAAARKRAYTAIERIEFPGGFYRRDIGARAFNREGLT